MSLVKMLNDHMTPLGKTLGIVITEATPDLVVGEMTGRSDLLTLPGRVHGGAIMALADNLGAMATVINIDLAAGDSTTTIESKTNFLSFGIEGEKLIGVCEPLHKGGTTQVWQTTVSREDGRKVAVITQTQLVLKKRE